MNDKNETSVGASPDQQAQQGALGVASGSAFARFPRTPERDAQGNAQLYPGAPKYEGVAAIFTDSALGEIVVLAPSHEDLARRLNAWNVTPALDLSKCRPARLALLLNH